jgi:hypothetical protein
MRNWLAADENNLAPTEGSIEANSIRCAELVEA